MNDRLKDILLTGDNEKIQRIIKTKYMYTNYETGDLLVEDLEEVKQLDKSILEIGIIRLKSMEELYDPSKSVTIIMALVIIVLTAYSDFFSSLFKDKVWIFLSKTFIFGGALIWLSQQIQSIRYQKWRVVYFKGLLERELATRNTEK